MTDAISPMPPYDWQQTVWSDFCSRHSAGKLPHALLLIGPEGIGLEELAVAMGQYLLCLSPMKQVACGSCRGCQLTRADTHPDLMLVGPEEKAKQIKVDQIRQVAAKVAQTAQQGGQKVILIRPVEAMNVNAANALLKNLEEPAGNTVLILTSHQLHRVLPTIRSRCAKISLAMPDHTLALNWLRERGVTPADILLHEAMGAPLLAKQWFDKGSMDTRQQIVKELVQIAERRLEPMAFAKKWASTEPADILAPMLSSIDAVLAQKLGDRQAAPHLRATVEALNHCQENKLYRLRDQLCNKKAQLQSSANLNTSIFIEELSLDWEAVVKRSVH